MGSSDSAQRPEVPRSHWWDGTDGTAEQRPLGVVTNEGLSGASLPVQIGGVCRTVFAASRFRSG